MKTAREILRQFAFDFTLIEGERKVDQALKDLYELLQLPKKKFIPELPNNGTGIDQFSGGLYLQARQEIILQNQTIDECNATLKAVFEQEGK